MLARWPGHIEAGGSCDDYLIVEDFYPSLLELAGLDAYETVQTIDGLSFVPLLTQSGNPAAGRSLFWHFPNHWGPTGPGIGATSSIRQGDWKLIYYHTDQRLELFNLAEDLSETNNLAETEERKRKELATQLGRQLRAMEAQMPRILDTDQAIPWPDSLLTTILSE
jgi:arylsulfatase A-like enzyme